MKWDNDNTVRRKHYRSTRARMLLVALSFVVAGALGAVEIVSASTVSAPPNNLGLVGYWSFDEGGGTQVGDASGNGHHGVMTNMDAATDWVDGRFGSALNFDGVNDYVDVGNHDALNFDSTEAFTYSIWFRPENYTDVGSGYAWFQHERSYFLQRATNDMSLTSNIAGAGTPFNVTPPAGEWSHAALTYDNGTLTLYFNGEQVNQASVTAENMGSSSMFFGTYQGGTWSANGDIDEIRGYSRALTSGEIHDLYQRGRSIIQQPDRTGLVGYWSFNEGSGARAGDFSGNNNHGTFNGGPQWTTGRYGKGLEFDGADDFLSIDNAPELDVTTSYTLSAWIKPDVVNNYNLVFFRGTGSASEIEFYGRQSDTVILHNRSGSGGTFTYQTGPAFTANTWMHVVVVYNNSTSEWKVYYDGVEQNFTIASGNGEPPADNDSGWRIGKNAGSFGSSEFNGTIDEVRIYNRALSAGEIRALHETTQHTVNASRNTLLTDGLVTLWSFDGPDVDGTTAYDRSGSGNNGTRSGTTAAIGVIGQALSFDGVDDHVVNNTPNVGVTTGAFTVSFWMKPRSTSGRMMPFSYGSNNTNQSVYFDWADGDQNIEIEWWGVNGVAESGTLALNEWHHVVGKYDGSRSYLYIDGEEVASTAFSGSSLSDSGYIGAGKLINWGGEFDGDLDDVRMYDRALSAGEVQRLYRMGR